MIPNQKRKSKLLTPEPDQLEISSITGTEEPICSASMNKKSQKISSNRIHPAEGLEDSVSERPRRRLYYSGITTIGTEDEVVTWNVGDETHIPISEWFTKQSPCPLPSSHLSYCKGVVTKVQAGKVHILIPLLIDIDGGRLVRGIQYMQVVSHSTKTFIFQICYQVKAKKTVAANCIVLSKLELEELFCGKR